jgi:NAD(P)-dependent dehydrogenase (short-subunit alcohol dehydrogenase family)
MPKKTESLTYLVTGANRGIGLAFARALSGRGDRVVATARRPEKARELGKLPLRLEQLDVADEESIAGLARSLSGEPLDVLINNAGIGHDGPAFETLSMRDLEQALRVNAIGPVAVTQALLGNLRAGRRRVVVNLSSGLASISENESGGWIAYRASKAALNQLTRTVAAELKKERFICVAICPGWVRTDMGGAGASVSPEDSVAAMLKVIDRLSLSDTGRFLDRLGKDLSW